VQHVDERDDYPQPGFSHTEYPTQPEQHTLLVLLDDLQPQRYCQQEQSDDSDGKDDQNVLGVP
jgi:hypothetical protein